MTICVLDPTILEAIRALAEIVTAAFAIVLALATISLRNATSRLDEHELQKSREEDLRRCILLAEMIIRPSPERRAVTSAYWSSADVRPFSELLTLNRYFHDADTRRDLEYLSSAQTTALAEGRDPMRQDAEFNRRATQFRDRLTQEVIEWQRDLGSYQRG